MKKSFLIVIAAFALLLTSCRKHEGAATIHVHVNDFAISQEDFPSKSDPVSDYPGVKTITLAFYDSNGNEAYKTTQFRADASTYVTFGEFNFTLNIGSYTMVVIGSGSESEITLTSPTSASYTDKCRETFAYTQAVNITTTEAVDLSATLSRVIARVRVQSTDNLVPEAKTVCVTFTAGSKSFNPTTGLATSNTGFTNNITVNADVGDVAYFFLATDEQTMSVSVDILDEDNKILYQKVATNVPMKRNKTTVLQGVLFSSSSSAGFDVDTDWLSDVVVPL